MRRRSAGSSRGSCASGTAGRGRFAVPALLIAFAALAVAAGLAPSCIHGGETTDAGPAHPVGRAVSFGGPGQEFGQAIATWGSATFLAGRYEGALRLGSTSFSAPARSAIFVARLDREGVPVWAVSSRGKTSVDVKAMDVDTAGNVYIVGEFTDKLELGSDTHYTPWAEAAFVARLDRAGNWTWSLESSGSSGEPDDIAVRGDAVYAVGDFGETLEIGSKVVTSTGRRNLFVARMDRGGRVAWLRQGGGAKNDSARTVTLDSQGNVYIAGQISTGATRGSLSLTFPSTRRMYVAAASPDGTFQRARTYGQGSESPGVYRVSTGPQDKLYVAGNVGAYSPFPGCSLSPYGDTDAYLVRLDPSDLSVDWCVSAGSGGRDGTRAVAVRSGAAVFAGFSASSVHFGTLGTVNGSMFLAVASLEGTPLLLEGADGFVRDLALDTSGDLYVTGSFSGAASLGTTTLKAHGDADIFVWRTRLP